MGGRKAEQLGWDQVFQVIPVIGGNPGKQVELGGGGDFGCLGDMQGGLQHPPGDDCADAAVAAEDIRCFAVSTDTGQSRLLSICKLIHFNSFAAIAGSRSQHNFHPIPTLRACAHSMAYCLCHFS